MTTGRRSWNRHTLVDVALVLGLAVWGGIATWATATDQPALKTCLALVTIGGLLVRRRAPAVACAVVAAGLTAESLVVESPDQMAVLLTVVVAAFSVTAYGTVREAFPGLVLLALAIAASIAVDPSDELSNIPPTVALFLGVPFGLGLAFSRRGRDLEAERARAAAAELRATEVLEGERRRLARELHDVVSHAVTLIAVQAEAGQARLAGDPAGTQRSLEAIGTISRDALAELQALLTLLEQPGSSLAGAGVADLGPLIEGVRATGLQVDLVETGSEHRVEPGVDGCAYRVIQEGLTNAVRHARSPRIVIEVDRSDGLQVSVTSHGQHHHSRYGSRGSGLAGLRERVAEFGGDLQTTSTKDEFVLTARFPQVVG